MAKRRICTTPYIIIGLLLVSVSPGKADTIFVAPDGTGDVPTIRDAINTSADGDTILLGDGLFSGDGNRDLYIFDKGLVIRSLSGDPTQCIVDCGGSGGELHTGFVWEMGDWDATSLVEGISITGGNATGVLAGFGSAIFVYDNSSVTVRNCRFYGNRGTAITLFGNETALENCVITGNYEPEPSGIAGVEIARHTRIRSCTVSGNRGPGGGIGLGLAGRLQLFSSVVWGNCSTIDYPYDEIFANDGLVTIYCCVVDSSGVGSFQPAVLYGYGNVFTNPVFCDPSPCEDAPTDAGDYHVDVTSPCLPPGNLCAGLIGALGLNCTGATPTLETSWGAIKDQYRGTDR